MNRMERFEKIWSAQHAVPPESLLQYRWVTQEGYRQPAMAAHFRTFCETLDSIVIELPSAFENAPPYACYEGGWNDMRVEAVDNIESLGLKVEK